MVLTGNITGMVEQKIRTCTLLERLYMSVRLDSKRVALSVRLIDYQALDRKNVFISITLY